MTPCRGFLAIVGAATFTGDVESTARGRPTLILPQKIIPDVRVEISMLRQHTTRMGAFFSVLEDLPLDAMDDWLERGLRHAAFLKARGRA